MKKIPVAVKLSARVEAALKKQEGFEKKNLLKNVFVQAANSKFAKGTSLENNRQYAKVLDRLDDAIDGNGTAELNEEQFKFLLDVLSTAELPPNTVQPEIVDFLEQIKIEQKEDKK